MNNERNSTVDTLVSALRILSVEIQSGDGVANAAISEAAERLALLQVANAAMSEAAERLALLQEKSVAVLRWYYRVGDVGDVGGPVEPMEELLKAAGVTEEWLCRK